MTRVLGGTYGEETYGQAPYGSRAFDPTQPSVLNLVPPNGGSGVLDTDPISFQLTSPSHLDPWSLAVTINGQAVIAGGDFLPGSGYAGTIIFDGPTCTVAIPTHPAWPTGSSTVSISVTDLSGNNQVFLSNFIVNVHYITNVSDSLTLSETVSNQAANTFAPTESFSVLESLSIGTVQLAWVNGQLTVSFPLGMRVEGVTDLPNYSLVHVGGSFPVELRAAAPVVTILRSGSNASVLDAHTVGAPGASFGPSDENRYLSLQSAFNTIDYVRILQVLDPATVLVDRPLLVDPANGSIPWTLMDAVEGVVFQTSKPTDHGSYIFSAKHLRDSFGDFISFTSLVTPTAPKPMVTGVQFLPDGQVVVTFSDPMLDDAFLTSPSEYSITGPSLVEVKDVHTVSPNQVVLTTLGMTSGSYLLTVNATGTPHDSSGNPIDPTFNTAIFTGNIPLTTRSIFTDRGPIVRPALTLQSGTGGAIQTYVTSTFGPTMPFTSTEVILPGGAFTTAHVGLEIELGNSTVNGGTYKVLGVVSATRVKLKASFHLPDVNNGSLTWKLIDPRTGEIADDPTDVVVRVNGVPVVAESVIGLLGQIVLPVAPGAVDDVKVDYSWVCDPTIEFRRLNSKEFKLNNWTNEQGRDSPTQHAYRYRNVTITPGTFVPDDIRAGIAQPLLRELHYKAYERAYSVALNDPNLLLLNTPIHKIAYPPLSRTIDSSSISYLAATLPENDPTSPWERKGLGFASVSGGNLTLQDNTIGPFPTGNPLFWRRNVDLTFPHVFAATWRMKIDATTPSGIFTGIAVGWSNDKRAIVLGYLLDGGIRKIGFLKKGHGNDPSALSSWGGGILPNGNPSGLPFDFDWSVLHSYRFFRGRDGIVRLFVDGEIIENLRILEDDLPYLEELNDPFDQIQGAYFGSLSREASNTSTWSFVRYLVLPTNPVQTTPSIFSSYEGNIFPEDNPTPWTPVGYHGNESIFNDTLILDSTSATTQATSTDVGLVGGDFRGYTRIEPLLAVSSDVVLDLNVQLRTFTHGITPNAVMAAIDDGNLLVQLCFFPSAPQPKVSYPGRSLPEDATPRPWTPLGTSPVQMLGRTLRISDDSVTAGRVYFIEDLEPMGSPNRIIETSIDYYAEFKLQVQSFAPDGTPVGFCGATLDLFDGTKALGLMLRQTGLTLQVAFHSDGNLLGAGSQYLFNWNDGLTHVYRIVKSTAGDLVSLFIDNTLIGSFAYSSFMGGVGNPTVSFGSATATSISSKSVMDWFYVNTWRAQPSAGTRRYAGIWKGTDSDSLTGYHLPLKTSGHASVVGNVLTDITTNFLTAGVAIGDDLIVDVGGNKGVYSVASVGANTLTVTGIFPTSPTEVDYRLPAQTDWTVAHKYRILRDPGGSVALYLDSISTPLLRLDYNEMSLPSNSVGMPYIINKGMPSITWGALDPTNLSQTAWDFLRYGITRSPTEIRIVPHHQFLNQRNVMSSPEHLFTSVVHDHTDFSSSSTGIPYPWQEFADNAGVIAFTKLGEGTPLVPSTQTYEVRRPTPVFEFISGLNLPADVLNNGGNFLLNNADTRTRILVPKDVLYNCLQVVEQTTGEPEHVAPFSDECNPIAFKQLNWTKEVCGIYDGSVLPENDPNFGTQWVLQSDNPGDVTTTAFSGILTYGVGASGDHTIYRNPTPLTDPVGLRTQVDFRLKLLNDATFGLGDSGVRFGFNALGLTAALGFITTPLGDREVRLIDLNSDTTLGAIPFDFLDGAYHVYRLVKNVADGTLDFLIDP